MLRVGLTGGFASGKTFVGNTLRQLGCSFIQADELGHRVLLPGGEAYDAVVNEFGDEILDQDQHIDRKKLASIVFPDAEKLKKLSSFVHPAVFRREEQIIAGIARADPAAIVVVEAAILVETGSHVRFERLVLTVCSPEQQMERALAKGPYTKEEIMARLSRQLPLEHKRQHADYVIDTSGTPQETIEQTRAVYESLRSLQQ